MWASQDTGKECRGPTCLFDGKSFFHYETTASFGTSQVHAGNSRVIAGHDDLVGLVCIN